MFLSQEQIARSIKQLSNFHVFFGTSFLAFKTSDLPVGATKWVVFSSIVNDLLDTYYRPCRGYAGYYHPFATVDQEQRWHPPRYGSTSLQRITTDTFRDAFIHEKNKPEWGWVPNYVSVLMKHKEFSGPIPAFDLAVWLFRERNWVEISCRAEDVVEKFFEEFHITPEEKELFDSGPPRQAPDWLAESPVTEEALLQIIGHPPGVTSTGARLLSLDMIDVGPGRAFHYEPAERLNIITGDNSLGKTFILDCAWWALTGGWAARPILPHPPHAPAGTPRIGFAVGSGATRGSKKSESVFDRKKLDWTPPKPASTATAGLVVFAQFDGSFAVWDSALKQILSNRDGKGTSPHAGALPLSRKDVWDGTPDRSTCNGLLRDWIAWQKGGPRHRNRWGLLCDCLERLSPSQEEKLRPGEPTRLLFNDNDIPTLQMPRGEIPVVHTSAGVQRAAALAYVLVWSWFRHQEYSDHVGERVKRQLVVILDEAEAHLHPRWQRVIVPAIMRVLEALAPVASPQIHLATHSPMVMASAETVFDHDRDALHHLKLADGSVVLDRLDFVKRGRADLWLMSEVFGLAHARSLEGEQAIEAAKAIQLAGAASAAEVQEVHARLLRYLAQDDDFWPRWRYFALQHGVADDTG